MKRLENVERDDLLLGGCTEWSSSKNCRLQQHEDEEDERALFRGNLQWSEPLSRFIAVSGGPAEIPINTQDTENASYFWK